MEKVRNERLKKKKGKGKLKKFLGLILLCLAGFLLFRGGEGTARFLYTSPIFALKEVFLEGNRDVEEAILRRMLEEEGANSGVNIFQIPLRKVKADLESHPRIKEAFLRRKLPARLIVSVEERFPVARIESEGKLLEVDGEGFILGEATKREEDLPLIRGLDPALITSPRFKTVPEILKYVYSFLKTEAREINFLRFPEVTLTVEKEARVYLGKKDFLPRIRFLKSILTYNKSEGIQLQHIDLRFSRSAYAKPIAGKVSPLADKQ